MESLAVVRIAEDSSWGFAYLSLAASD